MRGVFSMITVAAILSFLFMISPAHTLAPQHQILNPTVFRVIGVDSLTVITGEPEPRVHSSQQYEFIRIKVPSLDAEISAGGEYRVCINAGGPVTHTFPDGITLPDGTIKCFKEEWIATGDGWYIIPVERTHTREIAPTGIVYQRVVDMNMYAWWMRVGDPIGGPYTFTEDGGVVWTPERIIMPVSDLASLPTWHPPATPKRRAVGGQ